jgi:hypothetical protein
MFKAEVIVGWVVSTQHVSLSTIDLLGRDDSAYEKPHFNSINA